MSTQQIPRLGQDVIERLNFPFEMSLQRLALSRFLLLGCRAYFIPEVAFVKSKGMYWNEIDVIINIRTDLEDALYYQYRQKLKINSNLHDLVASFVGYVVAWMDHIHRYIFRPLGGHPLKAVSFLHCIVLNERGIIDYASTAKRLLNEASINDADKLRIACTHCLEAEIKEISRRVRLPTNMRRFAAFPRKLYPFWRTYLLEGRINEDIETLIHLLCYNNEPAFNFLWNKLTEEQKRSNIVKLFRNCNADVQCRLLNIMSVEEQKKVLKDTISKFVINLRTDYLWSQYYFRVIFFSLEFIREDYYYEIMKNAVFQISFWSYKTNGKNIKIVHQLWNYASQIFKNYFFRRKPDDVANFFSYLREEWDFDFFKKVLSEAPVAFRQQLLESENGMMLCCDMLEDKNQNYKTFHELVAIACPVAEDALSFKMKLVNEDVGENILSNLFDVKNRQRFHEFLRTIFITEENINDFKKQYLFASKSLGTLESRIREVFFVKSYQSEIRNALELNRILEYVQWFINTEEEINDFKRNCLPKKIAVKRTLLEVIEQQRYDLADAFLRWCFNDQLSGIDFYKFKFYEDELKNRFIVLASKFVQVNDNLQTFYRFLNWFLLSDRKRREFCRILMYEAKNTPEMWWFLLYHERFDMVNRLIELCGYSTAEEIAFCKRHLMWKINWGYVMFERKDLDFGSTSDVIIRYASQEVIREKKRIGKSIYAWFNPDEETMREFTRQNRYYHVGDVFFDYLELVEVFE